MSEESQVIQEHETVTDEGERAKLKQSPNELKLIKRLEKEFTKAKKHREKYDHEWMDFYKMFRGRQWKEQRPDYRHSEVFNLIFSTIQGMVPILTDSRPKFEYLAQEPTDIEFAEILNQAAEHDWTRFNWLYQLSEVLFDGHIFGTGISSLQYDKSLDFGLGAPNYESVDPLYCYPDAKARDVNKKCRYFFVAEPMELSEIKKIWPEKGKYIKPDIDSNEYDRSDMDKIRYKSPTDNVTIFESDAPEDSDQKQALVIKCYYEDDEIVEEEKIKQVESKDDQGNALIQEQKTYLQKKKYPKGRMTAYCNGILLQDDPNPYEDGMKPFHKYVNYILPREFWGESDIKNLQSPQKIFNKLVSFTLDVLTLMGNPIWVVDTNAEVDTDALFNRPGLVVEKNPGSEVRREAGVQLQPYVLQVIDRVKALYDDISGQTDVSSGATPTGVKSGIAITALQEAAQTRLRQKSRNLDVLLQDFGQQYKSRVLQFYTSPRMIRLTNNKGAAKYFRFKIEEREEQGEDGSINKFRVARVQNFVQNEANSEITDLVPQEERELKITGDFDTKVRTGTLLPFNKAQKEAKLLNYYRDGLIDAEEVLKNDPDFPNWEQIRQRVVQQQQAQQEAEAAAGQQV